MTLCRTVSTDELERALLTGKDSPRRRGNLNLHTHLSDPIQRFFNCLVAGTYVRPHRHAPGKFELFVRVFGRAGVLLFDGEGRVTEKHLLAPEGLAAVEIPGGVFHTVVALASTAVLFEVKPGPYEALTDKDFAPWSPPEGDPASAQAVTGWEALFRSDFQAEG